MKRRRFLQSAAASSLAGLAGCTAFENLDDDSQSDAQQPNSNDENPDSGLDLGGSSPEVQLTRTLEAIPRLVSSNENGSTFTVTVQNTGYEGNIAIGFFWQMERNAIEPTRVNALNPEGYQSVRTRQVFFSSGERRTIEFTALPPSDAIGYYFNTQSATYGARVRNTGSAGRVRVVFDYLSSPLGLENTEEKTIYLNEGETRPVVFNVLVEPGSEWEIRAEPAE